jgi:hypothetical protein
VRPTGRSSRSSSEGDANFDNDSNLPIRVTARSEGDASDQVRDLAMVGRRDLVRQAPKSRPLCPTGPLVSSVSRVESAW